MILSKLHRFLFIKGVKVGGTSIEIALSPLCGPNDIITPITPIDELFRLRRHIACPSDSQHTGGARNYAESIGIEDAYRETLLKASVCDLAGLNPPPSVYFNHMPLRDVLRLQGAAALNYEVVFVERNPYAKIFSWVNHQLSINAYRIGGEMRSDWRNFKNHLDRAIEDNSVVAVKNIDRYRGLDDRISGRMMRFEHIVDDFKEFVYSFGIYSCGAFPHAKRGIGANALNPREILTKEQILKINSIFEEEFVQFNYLPL